MLSGDKPSFALNYHPLKGPLKLDIFDSDSAGKMPSVYFTPTGSRLFEINFSLPLKWNYGTQPSI